MRQLNQESENRKDYLEMTGTQNYKCKEMIVTSIFITKSQEKLFAKRAQESMLNNARADNGTKKVEDKIY